MSGTVTGIGGVFFRAENPGALTAWYTTHLGITVEDFWTQEPGDAVFAPFTAKTEYWASEKQWMLNFRVRGLDALLARLAAAGIPAEQRAEWNSPETGRYARIRDPEGNEIELWEPPGEGGADDA
ncbi:MAG: VOC family protein [Pseudomonadota bacterium]